MVKKEFFINSCLRLIKTLQKFLFFVILKKNKVLSQMYKRICHLYFFKSLNIKMKQGETFIDEIGLPTVDSVKPLQFSL